MNSLQIDYFLAVARNLSFTKAASELYVSQPAISRKIAALEKELGFTLFDRTKKNTTLTKPGELFFELFSTYRLELLETISSARKYNGNLSGTLMIGCATNWDTVSFMPAVFRQFQTGYPHVEVHLESRGFRELLQGVMNDFLDVIITIDATIEDTDLIKAELTTIPRILLFSSECPQAQLEEPSISDFCNETFLVPDEFDGVGEYVYTYFKSYGFRPRVKLVPNIESAITMAMSGLGVCITDSWMREKLHPAFRYVEMDSYHTISAAWKKSNTNSNIKVLLNELLLHCEA